MLDNKPQAAWLDLPAAVALSAELLQSLHADDDARQAVDAAGVALVATYGRPVATDEAKVACTAFMPMLDAVLRAVTWRRLIEAQRATAKLWAESSRHGG